MNAMVLHHRRRTAFARSTQPHDRRTFQRFEGDGLMVSVNGRHVEVKDFSLGGIRLENSDLSVGDELEILVVPRIGAALQSDRAVQARVRVHEQCNDWTRLNFTSVTFSLAKLLIQQMSKQSGIKPFIFK